MFFCFNRRSECGSPENDSCRFNEPSFFYSLIKDDEKPPAKSNNFDSNKDPSNIRNNWTKASRTKSFLCNTKSTNRKRKTNVSSAKNMNSTPLGKILSTLRPKRKNSSPMSRNSVSFRKKVRGSLNSALFDRLNESCLSLSFSLRLENDKLKQENLSLRTELTQTKQSKDEIVSELNQNISQLKKDLDKQKKLADKFEKLNQGEQSQHDSSLLRIQQLEEELNNERQQRQRLVIEMHRLEQKCENLQTDLQQNGQRNQMKFLNSEANIDWDSKFIDGLDLDDVTVIQCFTLTMKLLREIVEWTGGSGTLTPCPINRSSRLIFR